MVPAVRAVVPGRRGAARRGLDVDVLASTRRDRVAARRFFARALAYGRRPVEVTTDKARSTHGSLTGCCPSPATSTPPERTTGPRPTCGAPQSGFRPVSWPVSVEGSSVGVPRGSVATGARDEGQRRSAGRPNLPLPLHIHTPRSWPVRTCRRHNDSCAGRIPTRAAVQCI
ncbi:DDE-type integrase/transposase/recombinase [Parafrankia sp. FMc6]